MFSFFHNPKEVPKHEVLQQLKALNCYQEHSFEDETKEAIDLFLKDLNATINAVIETTDESYHTLADEITQKATTLRVQMREAQEKWEIYKGEIKISVEKGLSFVLSTNFYPPEYVFHLNKIEGFITDIAELQVKNPLASANEFFEFRDQVERNIALFSELHQETIGLMEKIEKRATQKQKKETQEMLEIKESLFRALQMGNLEDAKRDLKKLKKEVNRF